MGLSERRATPPALLSRSTRGLLRHVLHARSAGWFVDDGLARTAGAAVADARRQRASAARLVVAVRRAWTAAPDRHRVAPQEARDLLNRLVTSCVHAYYGEHYDETRDGMGPAADAPGPHAGRRC